MFVLYNLIEVIFIKKELILVTINEEYCNYLRKFDNKVPYNYGNKNNRPFIGILFEVNKCMYFAPLSSPKQKHLKMKNKIDFLKLDNGKLGAVNFNNMIPVKKDNTTKIDLNKITSNKKDFNYQKLLKEQIYWLNRNKEKLYKKSNDLNYKYINKTLDKSTYERCCNFELLEEACNKYNN